MMTICVIQRDGEPVAACWTVSDADQIAKAFGVDPEEVYPVPVLRTVDTHEETLKKLQTRSVR